MNIPEIVKVGCRLYLRRECEMIQLRDEAGFSLCPSEMYPIGNRGPEGLDWSTLDLKAWNREASRGLLEWLKTLRSEFPEVAAEFASALSKAERVWGSYLAA